MGYCSFILSKTKIERPRYTWFVDEIRSMRSSKETRILLLCEILCLKIASSLVKCAFEYNYV